MFKIDVFEIDAHTEMTQFLVRLIQTLGLTVGIVNRPLRRVSSYKRLAHVLVDHISVSIGAFPYLDALP